MKPAEGRCTCPQWQEHEGKRYVIALDPECPQHGFPKDEWRSGSPLRAHAREVERSTGITFPRHEAHALAKDAESARGTARVNAAEFTRLVDQQREDAAHLAALETLYLRFIRRYGRQAASALRSSASVATVASPWQPPPEGLLFDPEAAAETVTADAAATHRRIFKDVAGKVLGFAGIAWDVKSPFARHFLDGLGQRTGALLGQGVQPVIQATVADAYDRGLSVPDTAALITENVADAGIVQARMLARTDLNGLANGASVMAATLVGVQYKQWLCLAPDTRVRALPLRVARRPADGRMVVLYARPAGRLSDPPELDRELTVSPDHPLLTGRGWIAAKFVEPGDRVFGCPTLDHGSAAVEPDVEDAPPTISEVFHAASERGATERMVGAVVNLYGERSECEVDVVAVDGELRDRVAAQLDEERAQVLFAASDVSLGAMLANSDVLAGRFRGYEPSPRPRALAMSGVSNVTVDYPPNLSGVRLTTHTDISHPQYSLDSARASANGGADLEQRFAGLVTPLEVVSVEVIAGTGYVYDLETESGWLLANGIIVHNSAEDDLVRETHAEADGQVVPVDQPFDVGGESLDYPGDPSGSDAECCNCRCSVIYLDNTSAGDAETASASPAVRVPSATMQARVPARGFATRPPTVPRVPRMPGRGFAAAVTITVDEPQAAEMGWTADLAFEGAATEDGRYILPDALGWRDLPLSLGAMLDTSHADVVTEAPVIGRIDAITKRDAGDGMTALGGTGIFDVNGDQGAEIARMVDEEMLNGVSIDLAVDDWCFRNPETGDLIEPYEMGPAEMEQAMMGSLQYAVRAGTIMGATVCPNPAFADARIAVTASGRPILRLWARLHIEGEALTASAAGLAPSKPPAAWFATPEADEPTPLTVTSDGRVFGHMALWDSCHTGYPGQCVPPPRSPSGYAYFNLGEIECADGSRVAAGALTLDGLHADTDRPLSPQAVRRHYEDTGMVAAFVKAVDGRHGIWVAGTLRADLPERYARDLMGAKPSGDWRQLRPGGPLEMLGVRAVNFPGFPVPRMVAAAMAPSGVRAELQFAES